MKLTENKFTWKVAKMKFITKGFQVAKAQVAHLDLVMAAATQEITSAL